MADDYRIATDDLFLGHHRAYGRGDKVFDFDAIEKWGWQENVAAADSQEAREAQGIEEPLESPPSSEPPEVPQPPKATTTTTAAGGKDK